MTLPKPPGERRTFSTLNKVQKAALETRKKILETASEDLTIAELSQILEICYDQLKWHIHVLRQQGHEVPISRKRGFFNRNRNRNRNRNQDADPSYITSPNPHYTPRFPSQR